MMMYPGNSICRSPRILFVVVFLVCSLFWTQIATATCSAYSGGQATFNEYYFGNAGTNFLEVYIKDISAITQADWQGWTLHVYTPSKKGPPNDAVYTLDNTTTSYCVFGSKAYITYDIPAGLPSPDIAVALKDAAGNEIDYMDACGPPGTCTLPTLYTPDAGTCSPYAHDLKINSLGNKDISRFPDGTGNWDISSNTGGNTTYTQCTINNAGVSKVASSPTVALGSNMTFTLTANNGNKTSGTYDIQDPIPSGFTYVSSTPSQGSVTVSAGTVDWAVGTLAGNGGTATLTITVTGTTLGTFTNTATVAAPCTVTPCPSDSATVSVVVPPVDHFAISHSGTAVNCEPAQVTISAHNADHSINTAFTGTLNLSTSTGKGDWTIITGAGTINNGIANDGIATYNMVAGDSGVVVLGLKDTTPETVNINVASGTITETSGTALASEDQNLVFSQTGFRFIDASNVAIIGTQISGKNSNLAPGAQTLYVQAIRSSNNGATCSGVFPSGATASIGLGSVCNDPGSCLAGQRVSVTNNGTTTAIANPQNLNAGLSYTNVPLLFTTNSRAALVLNYPDAGSIQLNARYDIPLSGGGASGNVMTGNSNSFVVRPFGFDLDFSNDRATNGITGVSYAADANGSKFQIAGANFPLSLSAVAWSSVDDTNNDGIPDACANLTDNTVTQNFGNETTAVVPANVTLSNTLVAPATGVAGTLSTSLNGASFSSGVGSKTISWNEVGIMNLSASLPSYLGSGQNTEGNVCNVGRFYPNNFAILNPALTNRSDIAACPDLFTYMGENFNISYSLQAISANPPGTVTQNYIGTFAKLDPTVLAQMNYGAGDSGTNLTARLGVSSVGAFAAGVAPVTATLQFARNTTADGAYKALKIGIAPSDSDSVALLASGLNLSLDGGPNTHGLLGQTDVRYGRLNLQNNFGSELLAQTLPLSTEYYDSSAGDFTTNVDDSCTTRTPADVLLYNNQAAKATRAVGNPTISVSGANTTTLTSISAFSGGRATMTFSAPGAEGYVDVEVQTPSWLLSDLDSIDQGIQGPDLHCTPGLVATDPAFVSGCVADLNIVDDVPLARLNFGIFKGSKNILYIREAY